MHTRTYTDVRTWEKENAIMRLYKNAKRMETIHNWTKNFIYANPFQPTLSTGTISRTHTDLNAVYICAAWSSDSRHSTHKQLHTTTMTYHPLLQHILRCNAAILFLHSFESVGLLQQACRSWIRTDKEEELAVVVVVVVVLQKRLQARESVHSYFVP